MALDSKAILADLAENYWEDYTLRNHIKDAVARSKFVWDALSSGQISNANATSLVVEYLADARFEPLANFLNITLDKENVSFGIKGWSYPQTEVFQKLAEDKPDFADSIPLLIEPLQTLAWMEFFKLGVVKEMPESCLPVLARAWYGHYDDWFFNPYKTLMESPAFEEQKRLVLTHPELTIREWKKIKELVPSLSVDEAVNIARGLDFNEFMQPMIEILERHGEAILEPMTRFVLEYENAYVVGAHAGVVSILCQRMGKPVPPEVMARMSLLPQQYYANLVPYIREALAIVPQSTLADWIQAAAKTAPTSVAGSLISLVDDTSFHHDVTKTLVEKVTKDNGEGIANNLALNGTLVVGPLIEAWDDKLPALEAEVIVKALQKVGSPLAAQTFVAALGHSSKGVRAVAEIGLADLGANAKDALEAGAKSKKKAVREFCVEALGRLQSAPATPALEIDENTRATMRAELLVVSGDSYPARDKMWADNEASIKASPVVWATVAAEYCLEKSKDYRHRMGLHFIFEKAPTTDVLRVYLETIMRGDFGSKYGSDEFINRLTGRHGSGSLPENFDTVLLEVLRGPSGPNRTELLQVYLEKAKQVDAEFTVLLLSESSKTVRELAVQRLIELGDSVIKDVAEQLSSKKKDTRKAAADVLASLKPTAQKAQIEKALKSEKTAEVVASLEKALQAAGGEVKGFEVAADASVADLEKLLESQPSKKMPKFLNVETLPPLLFKSGATLEGNALLGLLSRLALEGPDHIDDVARAIRPHLDDKSANAFSISLKDKWASAGGKAADKWCVYQQAILANEERMSDFAPGLDEAVSAGMHHLVGWYVDVLERHGSDDAKSWVGYWAMNAERRSLRDAAWAAIERLAAAASLSQTAFLATVNTYVADDIADRKVPTLGFENGNLRVDLGGREGEFQVDAGLGLRVRDETQKILKSVPKSAPESVKTHFKDLKKRLKSIANEAEQRFEFAMVSGRPWSLAAFKRDIVSHPILRLFVAGLVFRTDKKELFRVVDAELVDAQWNPIDLPKNAVIRVAHRMDLSAADIKAWGVQLGEAEITQPFEQLNRPVFAKTAKSEFGAVQPGTLAGRLRRMGWRNDSAEDAGMIYGASKLFAGCGVRARCSHGGIYAGDPSWGSEAITIDGFYFEDLRGESINDKDVDPIAYSEAIYDLTRIAQA